MSGLKVDDDLLDDDVDNDGPGFAFLVIAAAMLGIAAFGATLWGLWRLLFWLTGLVA